MVIGTIRARLLLREARSLKDKRQVVRSIADRLRNSFNVSLAEVDALEQRQLVVFGGAMVGREVHAVRSQLEAIAAALRSHPVAEFLDCDIDV